MKIIHLNVTLLTDDNRDIFIHKLDCTAEGWLQVGGFYSINFIAYTKQYGGCIVRVSEVWPLGKSQPLDRDEYLMVWDEAQAVADELCRKLRSLTC